MATTETNAIQPSNSTDANFRAWTKFVRDAMVAGGWLQTADTGQINFATVTRPLAPSTDAGYVIMRMADTHQALRPVYVRLTYGSGPGSSNIPRMGIGIGRGSDGAGNLTGGVGSSTILTLSHSTTEVNVFCFSSAGKDRAHVILFDDVLNPNFTMSFSIERGRTSTGAIDRDWVYFIHSGTGGGGGITDSHALNVAGGASGIAQTAICSIIAPSNTRTAQENYGVGFVLPIGPAAVVMRPATGYILTAVGDDWVNGAILQMYVYGVLTTYRRTQNSRWGLVNLSGANHIAWVRFD